MEVQLNDLLKKMQQEYPESNALSEDNGMESFMFEAVEVLDVFGHAKSDEVEEVLNITSDSDQVSLTNWFDSEDEYIYFIAFTESGNPIGGILDPVQGSVVDFKVL